MSNKYKKSRDEHKIPKFKDDYDIGFADMVLVILQAYKFLFPILIGIYIIAIGIMALFRYLA
ncbi:MAG: hypothetical protein JEZ08_11045 [Clostridiales bacterium]|nr:hypothetical protein [Clostridiales bacterium]